MNTENIKQYYNNYYKKTSIINPAYQIYDKLRIQAIIKYIPNHSSNLLIIGCGSRNDQILLNYAQNSYALDLSTNAVKNIKNQANDKMKNFLTADAISLPFPDNYFDTIVCSEVLEHIPKIESAIKEIYRVSKIDPNIVISTPNWLSLFGFSRIIAELILKKPMTSDNQPYDDWKTIFKFKRELSPFFTIEKTTGIWYLPPMHFRGKGLSKKQTYLIYHFFSIFDKLFSIYLPWFGHLLIIKCKKAD